MFAALTALHGKDVAVARALPPRGSRAALQLQQLAAARLRALLLENQEADAQQRAAWVQQLLIVGSCASSLSLQQPCGQDILAILAAILPLVNQQCGGWLSADDTCGLLRTTAEVALTSFAADGAGERSPGQLLPGQLGLCIEAASAAIGAALALEERRELEDGMLTTFVALLAAVNKAVVRLCSDPPAYESIREDLGVAESALGAAEAALRLAAQLAGRGDAVPAAGAPRAVAFQNCLALASNLIVHLSRNTRKNNAGRHAGACALASTCKLALTLGKLPAERQAALGCAEVCACVWPLLA